MKTIFSILFLFSTLLYFSQSDGKIKKYDIRSSTVTVTNESGKTKTEELKKFDENGNLIYQERYNKKGILKEKHEYKFSGKNELIEESNFDEMGNKSETIKHTYNLDLVTKSEVYDPEGVLVKIIVYTYNGFGEKMEELVTNAKNELIEKGIYTYDNKGLKTEKKTFDEKGKLIETKTYTYDFD